MEPITASDEEAIRQGCHFEQSFADRVKQFCEGYCRQSIGKWEGRPLTLMPWQHQLIDQLYGWRTREGHRRFRSASIWLPKNSGKSTIASALSLYHLLADNEPAAQVFNIASTVAQAGIVYKGCADMIDQSPALATLKRKKRLWVRKNIKAIEYGNSILRIASGERGLGRHGFSISFLILDELAEIVDRDYYEAMRHNCLKRDNSLMLTISTAGFNREGIGFEQFTYCKNILEGKVVDTSFLPIVYAAPDEAEWDSLETFKACNPGYNFTIDEATATTLIQEARNEPRKRQAYETLHLNRWVGSSACWLSPHQWMECKAVFPPLEGRECVCGLDLARRHDIAAYVLVFRIDDDYWLLPRFFMPGDLALRKTESDHVPYELWQRQGYIDFTPGDTIDYAYIRKRLNEDKEKYRITTIGYDPYGAESLRQQLEFEDNFSVVEVRQGILTMGPPTAEFERLIKEKKIKHDGNPVLNWMAGNCVVRTDANENLMVDKLRSTARVDGIQASIIGLSRAMVAENEPQLIIF